MLPSPSADPAPPVTSLDVLDAKSSRRDAPQDSDLARQAGEAWVAAETAWRALDCYPAWTQLTDLAWALQRVRTLGEVLDSVASAAVKLVPGAHDASVTFMSDGGPFTAAASSEIARAIDVKQYETGSGPALDALSGDAPAQLEEPTAAARWPILARTLGDHGVRSVLSLPLITPTGVVGALNLYSGQPAAFDQLNLQVADTVRAIASLAVASHQKAAEFERAVDSRDVIGQAKGILMERFRLTSEQAFRLLVGVSQHRHIKLRDLSRAFVETGQDLAEVVVTPS